jgi:hypothetical protein
MLSLNKIRDSWVNYVMKNILFILLLDDFEDLPLKLLKNIDDE